MRTIIFMLLVSCGCYAQNYSAYQNQQPLSGSVELPPERNSMPMPPPSPEAIERYRAKAKSDREVYQVIQDSAQVAFTQNDFKKCIYLFEKANGLKQFIADASFMYIAAVSYYKISVELDDKKYRKRAKDLLRQADYRGFVDARIFLKENF